MTTERVLPAYWPDPPGGSGRASSPSFIRPSRNSSIPSIRVLTYDRRGLSRSRLEEPGRTTSLAEHAEDVHRLLAVVTDEPALMLGCSMGALIGLHVAARYPEQSSTTCRRSSRTPSTRPN
uniref:alpha/beta fold hydrolase n=1 Tax=Streptomyces sp. NBC_00998 TaxID=2903712 RepID=UPI002F90D7BE